MRSIPSGLTAEAAIRRLSLDDLDVVVEINRAAATAAYREIFAQAPFPLDKVRERYRRMLEDPDCLLFGAHLAGHPAGFIAARPRQLESLYVLPASWRRGLGSRLYEAAEPVLADDATLWVLEANARGRAFWERHGWRSDGERKFSGAPELRYRRVSAEGSGRAPGAG